MSLESYQALLSSGGEAGGGGSSRESRDFRAGLKNSIIVSATVTLFGTMISIVSAIHLPATGSSAGRPCWLPLS